MEQQCSPLGWAYYCQEEGVDALKQSLLYSTLELEAAVVSAHDQISRKDDEIRQLKALLSEIIKERDEFQANALEKQLLFQQVQILAHDRDDNNNNNIVSTAGCKDTLPLIITTPDVLAMMKRPLPEQGKFHQAVMEAGPLLQTLLLAGPLPRWQHPPPQLNSIDIPPVATKIISPDSCHVSPTKRAMVSCWDGSPCSKYQKVCSPTITADLQHT